MLILVMALGIAGGLVSTLVGFGGGMILTLTLALNLPPLAALGVASFALLTGGLHRAFLFRHELSGRIAGSWAVAIVAGSITGSFHAHLVPNSVLRWGLVGGAVLAMAPRWLQRTREPGNRHVGLLLPVGSVIGFVGAGTAGVGPIASTSLIATGHIGDRYVGLMALCGVSLNVGRVVGYGSSGAMVSGWATSALLGAAGLMVGNLAGRRVRHRLAPSSIARLEQIMPWFCLAIALLGLLRENA